MCWPVLALRLHSLQALSVYVPLRMAAFRKAEVVATACWVALRAAQLPQYVRQLIAADD